MITVEYNPIFDDIIFIDLYYQIIINTKFLCKNIKLEYRDVIRIVDS